MSWIAVIMRMVGDLGGVALLILLAKVFKWDLNRLKIIPYWIVLLSIVFLDILLFALQGVVSGE